MLPRIPRQDVVPQLTPHSGKILLCTKFYRRPLSSPSLPLSHSFSPLVPQLFAPLNLGRVILVQSFSTEQG
jgi:hypothetical protein